MGKHGANSPSGTTSRPSRPAFHELPELVRRTILEQRGGRKAVYRLCRACGAVVLEGMDADRAAWTVQADPTPITALEEVLCVMVTRPTYTLRLGERWLLDYRDEYAVGKSSDRLVVPAHRCGARFASRLPVPAPRTAEVGCPF